MLVNCAAKKERVVVTVPNIGTDSIDVSGDFFYFQEFELSSAMTVNKDTVEL